jgi:zinc transport system ATP-binding protein
VSKALLVDVDNLSIAFGSEVVIDNVSFCIHKGEFIGLIGPNGAGKTTLLRAVLGLLQPTAGSVRRGKAVIGYTPQRGALYNGTVPMSVLEVIMLGSRGSRAAALQALDSVHLGERAHKKFTELSGGQQQRVSIAKALAGGADLLILDEPTTGIDEHSQAAFYELLELLRSQGITIVMVSHEVETVLQLVTRVICLNRTVLYDGPVEHFEADKYLPLAYGRQHVQLHHQHGQQEE